MDEIIEKVGEFGRFQYKIIVIVGLLSALSSACIYATIFIAAEPDFFCQTRNSTSGEFTKLSFDDSCQLWIQMQHNDTDPTNTTICEFDRTFYGRTIINDWHLICDSHYKASLTQTIHILGSIFAIFSGVIGDKFGRRTSVMWFSLALTFSLLFTQFLLSFDNSWFTVDVKYLIYSVAQFLIGFLVNCLYCTAYVLLMEFTTEHFRTKIANLNSYIYVLGELIVLVVYYFSRDWHVLNWFVGSFSLVLLVVIYFYLPESPAWYISQNKLKRAQKVLKQIARTNGRKKEANEITYELVRSIHSQEKSLMNDENDDTIDFLSIKHQPNSASSFQPNCVQSNGCAGGGEKLMNGDSDEKNGNGIGNSSHIKTNNEEEMSAMSILHDLFRPRKNCFKTSLLAYIWAALMLLYYGISLGVTSVELVNPYLMYFLSSIAEFIGYIFCYLNDILGRKKTLILFFLTTTLIYGSIALLSNGTADEDETFFSPKAISLMLLALVGKCAVSGAYNISYIYTSELHPTYTRNTALLFLNCVGSVSSLIAPQINLLKNLLARPAPYIVYSICALFGCVCVWILPETKVD